MPILFGMEIIHNLLNSIYRKANMVYATIATQTDFTPLWCIFKHFVHLLCNSFLYFKFLFNQCHYFSLKMNEITSWIRASIVSITAYSKYNKGKKYKNAYDYWDSQLMISDLEILAKYFLLYYFTAQN